MAAPFAPEVLPPEDGDRLPPIPYPILIAENGNGWIPHAFNPGIHVCRPVVRGIGLAWTPAPEVGGLLLCIAGGNPRQPTDEAVATFISRKGLREIIADLQSIDAQLEEPA
ncbi:MAG: hypothetical protein BGP16_05410 [Sphingobium sp. 66-54]|nr:MAG: hypothetical protein BGP16_05410 [Sphingobium sp. 66-54]